jgi:predicted ABC-type ATPase
MPVIYIIAGCNGAGKTTAAYSLLPDVFTTVEFINADEIARGLSPLNPDGYAFAAGRIMLQRLEDMIEKRESFAFETTLSGLSYINLITRAKANGFDVVLFFVYLESVELAQNRVIIRVSKGGHNIPAETIKRRYSKGISNFKVYASLASEWHIYDNSGSQYRRIGRKLGEQPEIFNFDVYNKLMGYESE